MVEGNENLRQQIFGYQREPHFGGINNLKTQKAG